MFKDTAEGHTNFSCACMGAQMHPHGTCNQCGGVKLPATNNQSWEGMPASAAFLLITQHADTFDQAGVMMQAWAKANRDHLGDANKMVG